MTDSVRKTIEALEKNRFSVVYLEKKEEVKDAVLSFINKGDVVSNGGSVTLDECGVKEALRTGDYVYLDRDKEGLTREDIEEIYRKTFSADVFLTSTNAITQNGELYNVDGNGNRIAAMMFGPKKVIVVAGVNKIVADIDEAAKRVKTVAAPKNCKRLGIENYCAETGSCLSLRDNENSSICDGCAADRRICSGYLISAFQKNKDKFKIILVNEKLGY